MRSHTTPDFRTAFAALPENIQEQAREAYRLFVQNPQHPGLRFKRIRSSQNTVYAARIGHHYRALPYADQGELYWFWIGTHAVYDQLMNAL